jgi:UDP-3-O-[3-hydroxymyristoyl] glucosamine N-acyltransferase
MADATINGEWMSRAVTVGELASRVEGQVEGDDAALVLGASSIEDAQHGDIVFAENARFLNQAIKSRASAIVAFLDAVTPDKPLIRVENPRYAFLKILELFRPQLNVTEGVHPTATIGQCVRLGEGASIGAFVAVGDGVSVGDRTIVMPGCFIGEDCAIGNDCILYPGVILYHGSLLGNRVVIHANTVIGADGFGYIQVGERSYKVPQIGIVDIGDDVEIGANCAIDRAKTGTTVIGDRTKIDNLVHIAHNVKVGSDCVIVAQVGVAGSSTLGRGVILAGQAGVVDHVSIGDGVVVMAQAGVIGDVDSSDKKVSGYPARPHMQKQRQLAEIEHLPETVKLVRRLEKRSEELSEANSELMARLAALERQLAIESTGAQTSGPETAWEKGTE